MLWTVNAAHCAIYSREGDPVPTAKEGGCVSGPVWTGMEYLTPSGVRSPDLPNHTEYAVPTALSATPGQTIKTMMTEFNCLRATEDKATADVTPCYLLWASWFWGQMVAGNTIYLRQIGIG